MQSTIPIARLVAGLGCLAIAFLLVRIATGGTFHDVGYLVAFTPWPVIAVGAGVAFGAALLGTRLLRGPADARFAAIALASVSAVLGVYLRLFNADDSGAAITAAAAVTALAVTRLGGDRAA